MLIKLNVKLGRPIENFLIKFKKLSTGAENLHLFTATYNGHIKNEILHLAKTYSSDEECASRLENILGQFNHIIKFHPTLQTNLRNSFKLLQCLIQDKIPLPSTQPYFFHPVNSHNQNTFSPNINSKDFMERQIIQQMFKYIESCQKDHYFHTSNPSIISSKPSFKRDLDNNFEDKRLYARFKKI